MFSQANSSIIKPATYQSIIQTSDAPGVYVPKIVGNQDPDLHYGIVIDCGSSGSRLYIYIWPKHSGNPNELLQIRQLLDKDGVPVVKKLEPGLSSMVKTPTNATEYLKSLLEFAEKTIPPAKHQDTPLYIFATAGLRLLAPDDQKKILEDLFSDIVRDYDFQIEKTHIQVISGQFEGIYSWIAINYVLGRFQTNDTNLKPSKNSKLTSNSKNRPETVGILDMGGASAQIAFEISSNTPVTGEEIAEFSLGYDDNQESLKYRIYVTTFLGYGANKIFEKYMNEITDAALNSSLLRIDNADCLPRGYATNYTRNNVTITLVGEGDFVNCSKTLTKLLNLNATCLKKPCSINGIYQPEINYDSHDFYGFSEFWYTMEDILKIGGPYARLTFLNASINYCNSDWNDIQKWYNKKSYPNVNFDRLMLQCFKSAWLYTFVHDGLKFPINYQRLRSASLVNNNDVQWTLGAILYRTRYLPLKSINEMKSSFTFHQFFAQSRTLFILIFMILTLILLIYGPRVIRTSIYRYKRFRSSSKFSNSRYQLLNAFDMDEPLSSTSNTYLNMKPL